MCSCVQLSKKKKKKIESDEDEELCKMQRKMKGSAKCKEKKLSLNLDLILKFVTFSSALYHLVASDLNLEETKFRNILFVRSIRLPETIISLFLLLTAILSKVSAMFLHRGAVYFDTFVLTGLEKLVMIGYNLHLTIFHVSLINKTESALLLLPLVIFILSAKECTATLLYLDSVFFEVRDWEESLLSSARLPSTIIVHHLLSVFVFLQFDTIGVQFTHSL